MILSAARGRTLVLALLLGLIATPWSAARADIYRCTAADGRTLYADAPCPRGAVHGANITSAVGACADEACALKREQAASQARARLRVEQDQLAQFADRRRRDEIEAENERARLEALTWRQSTDARLAVSADPGYAVTYAPYYPIWPVHPVVRPCGWRCVGLHPGVGKGVPMRRTWGTALRVDRR